MQYPKELVSKLQRYFKNYYKRDVDDETANEWLTNLADLYRSVSGRLPGTSAIASDENTVSARISAQEPMSSLKDNQI